MEQSKAMEYESRKASSGVLKPHNIYKLYCVLCSWTVPGTYLHTGNG